MELFYSLSTLIIIATLFAYINARFLKLPSTIGIMVITIIFSVGLVVSDGISPKPLNDIHQLIKNIDFAQLLMGGMLYFLLFAGAIQININDLKEQKLPIITFSTLSVILSTFIIGFVLYYSLHFLLPFIGSTIKVPLIYCLLFGALISPTDPIAVLSILKKSNVSKSLETKITGEALFNDGVAIILFTVLYSIAFGTEKATDISVISISWLLIKEIAGAFITGLGLGFIALYGMRKIDDQKLSILITLSVVITGYMISHAMEISGPLTMVSAGILIGNKSQTFDAEQNNFNFVKIFWELIDEILNAILFLLIGFELLIMPDLRKYWIIGVLAIFIVLIARYISIILPTALIPFRRKLNKSSIFILVWGGLRGGVSIALALALQDNIYRDGLLAATYYVVVFSIIVQGLSIGKLAKNIKK